ncbi:MAG TPA: FtsH protease activity modulator HflK [Accumulibacter sp.]|uniref:FtsH protease activity modulator HflK n=1 Tax=Accumulibacter sp. TaxID=2053492 RepID=UPI002B808227|nr:FtsH protease activity modulator HflK [Accumulibacter sp.]HRF72132.1 FtsH protease activity modulator HflK [Accumulibacter sp.]
MSLNDPQWGNRGNDDGGGRRPNQGPPDLEQLWRDLNRRLSGIFDRKRGGGDRGGDGGDQRPPVQFNPKFLGGGIGLLLVLVVVVWLASGFYIVDAGQRGLVLQFGRYKESSDPGLRWRLPYPVQSHELVNIAGVRTLEVGYRGTERNKVLKEALMLTDDENIINIQFAVQYILKDPVDYVFANRNPDEAVMQVAETAIRQIVGKNKMDFVLYEGREQVAVNASQLMQEILDRYKTGILISKVTMQNAQPPEQVQAAFDDAVKASQDRARLKNEGQAYANDVIPRAQGTAARLYEEAEGYKQRVIANAEGDASRFSQINTEYAKAPEVTRSRMYLDTMQQVYSNTSKVLVDTKGQGNLLYLPLDKLIQGAGALAASPVGGAGSPEIAATVRSSPAIANEVPPQIADRNEPRSRDTLRQRDRESR